MPGGGSRYPFGMATVFRADSSTLRFRRTALGVVADSRPARAGILTYRSAGKTTREFCPEEEAFHPDTLASLAGAPITVGHPKTNANGLVTAESWKKDACGHMGDDVRRDGEYLAATARVSDASVASRVSPDDLCEMSAGYSCDIEETPGTYKNQPYDVVQRNRRYNHVALLPRGAGRAGEGAGLRFDEAAYSLDMVETSVVPPTVLDAKDFVSKAEFDTVKGQLAAATAQLAEAKIKLDAADAQVSPASIDKLVQARTELVTRARNLVPAKGRAEFKTDGLSELEIMVSAIKANGAAVKLDAKDSPEFVRGVFSSLAAHEASVSASHAKVQETVSGVGKKDAERLDEDPTKAGQARIRAAAEKAYNDHTAGV